MIKVPLVSVAAAVLMAGCSADAPFGALPPVAVSPAPVASASPSLSPSPAARLRDLAQLPGLPVVARTRTAEGAAAFTRYFYQQIRVAFQARDPSVLATMSAPGCEACARYAASVTQARDQQQRVVILLKVRSTATPALRPGRPVRVDVVVDTLGSTTYDVNGKLIEKQPVRLNRQIVADLSWSLNRWSISELTARSAP